MCLNEQMKIMRIVVENQTLLLYPVYCKLSYSKMRIMIRKFPIIIKKCIHCALEYKFELYWQCLQQLTVTKRNGNFSQYNNFYMRSRRNYLSFFVTTAPR